MRLDALKHKHTYNKLLAVKYIKRQLIHILLKYLKFLLKYVEKLKYSVLRKGCEKLVIRSICYGT